MGRPAVFLDRDGVLNEPVRRAEGKVFESPLEPDAVRLAPAAASAVRLLQAAGFAVVVVSNQPGAAKAECTFDALAAVHERMVDLLSAEGVKLDGWYYCHHHPEGSAENLGRACSCRKPEPGMLLVAAADLGLILNQSWMIGDSDADIGAGRRAGCRTILVEHPATAHRRGHEVPDLRAPDLAGAWNLMQPVIEGSEVPVDA